MQNLEDKLTDFFNIYAIFTTPRFKYWCDHHYNQWLSTGCNGMMNYMSKAHRGDLDRVMEGSKSIIVVGKYYGDKQREQGKALFASGEDYHVQIKRELNEVLSLIKQLYGNVRGRVVVDTAPIFEKALAEYGGLGWVGRNSLIINETMGSFFNLGVLLVDVELKPTTHLVSGSCGECRSCIDQCPMGAIREDNMVDARRCISYQNIELVRIDNSVPVDINGWYQGCDECQLCCPYNKR